MRAVQADRAGPPDVLHLATVPVPTPGPDDVLVRIAAAGVGPWDLGARSGRWPRAFPYVPGGEVCGTVAALGARVTDVAVGERVYAYPRLEGGYAEFIASPRGRLARTSARLTDAEAAALPVNGVTAIEGLDDVLGVRAGQTVLVCGAAGGMGVLAVQIAAARGARVIATARPADHAFVRGLGAAVVVDYAAPDWDAQVRAATGGIATGGVDRALDTAGHDAPRVLAALNDAGDAASPAAGARATTDARGRPYRRYDGHATTARLDALTRLADAGRLTVPIAATYPLADAAAAHARLEAGGVRGKLVLLV